MEFENKIKICDVVLVKNNLKPKIYWNLARVIKLFPGDDNKIRIVEVKLGNGLVQMHSIKHLYPLELSLTHCASPNKVCNSENFPLNLNKSKTLSDSELSNKISEKFNNSTGRDQNNFHENSILLSDENKTCNFSKHINKTSRSKRNSAGLRKHDRDYIYY